MKTVVIDKHETNRRYWDDLASSWKELRERDGLWRLCATEPEAAFTSGTLDLIRAFGGDLKGKNVCVIGSGDNYAAFALAGLPVWLSVCAQKRQVLTDR